MLLNRTSQNLFSIAVHLRRLAVERSHVFRQNIVIMSAALQNLTLRLLEAPSFSMRAMIASVGHVFRHAHWVAPLSTNHQTPPAVT